MGRNLGALKSELGSQARGAFQALAQLKVPSSVVSNSGKDSIAQTKTMPKSASDSSLPDHAQKESRAKSNNLNSQTKYTQWTFGDLPEIMEINKGGQSLIGFPALVDVQDAVVIEVFDEPDVAAQKHREGLRRLFSLQIKDALKYLEKNIPDLQKMAVSYMPLGTSDELRQQIIEVALDRAFLLDPLPADEFAFKKRMPTKLPDWQSRSSLNMQQPRARSRIRRMQRTLRQIVFSNFSD
jgi:ATP-dependent helicase HrpA